MAEHSPISSTPTAGAPVAAADSRAGSSMGMAGLEIGAERWADDACHPQRSPGAYEWWHFEALDVAGNGAVITFFHGLPFHPHYQTQAAQSQRRLRKHPFDAVPNEALPGHYPAAYFGLYEGGRRVAQFLNLYPPGTFEGSTDTPEIRVGPNRLTLRTDGSFGIVARGYPYEIHGGAPKGRTDQILTATLNFAPSSPAVQHVRPFRPPGRNGATHTWVLAAPHGRITGRVGQISKDGIALRDMPINTLGYHDHNFGQGPLGSAVKRLAWGHVVGDTWTMAWQRTLMKGRAARIAPRPDAILLFQPDSPDPPLVIESPVVETSQMRTTRWLISYPGRATMHGSDAHGNSVELVLHHDSVLEATPFYARLAAKATLTVVGKRQYTGTGSTTAMQLQRVWWPLMSDMILMSIVPVASDDPLWRQ